MNPGWLFAWREMSNPLYDNAKKGHRLRNRIEVTLTIMTFEDTDFTLTSCYNDEPSISRLAHHMKETFI